jgi:putative transposase
MVLYSLLKAAVLIERRRRHYDTVRPHGAFGGRPIAPEAVLWRPTGPAYVALRCARPSAPKHGPALPPPMDPTLGSGHRRAEFLLPG